MTAKQRITSILLIAVGLVALRQAIVIGIIEIDQLRRHVGRVEELKIDPTALYYTESQVVLDAEKEVTRRMQKGLSTGP